MASFQRRGKQAAPPPKGTRPSAFNAQLLCSTGLADLDAVLGGGLAVGTVLVVGEDPLAHYVDTLLAYFMAEAVACGHPLAVADPTPQAAATVLTTLPWPSSAAEPEEAAAPPPKPADSGLKIAWQYAKYAPAAAAGGAGGRAEAAGPRPAPPLCASYSFGCNVPPAVVDAALPHFCHIPVDCGSPSPASSTPHDDVFIRLADFVASQTNLAASRGLPESTLLFRVVLRDFGGLGWGGPGPDADRQLQRLFFRLTGLVRTSRMVAVVAVPNVRADRSFFCRLCHMADAALELRAWAGAGVPVSAFEASEYTGRLDIVKLPRVNSLVAFHNGVAAVGFTVRSTGRLTIQRFSLPPGDDVADAATAANSAGCAPGGGQSLLDF